VRTSKLRLGTSVVLLPLHHPLEIAEQVATVDHLSNGRVFLGPGLGYRPHEYRALGLDYAQRGSRMTEALQVVRLAWTEEKASFHGRHFDFDEVEVLPRPLQQPHPRIWVGVNSDPGMRRAARLGDGLIVGFGDPRSALLPKLSRYRALAAEAGQSSTVCLMRLVGIAARREEVEEQWLPPVINTLRGYRRAGAPGDTDKGLSSKLRSGSGEPLTLDRVGGEQFIAGTPDDCIRQVREWVDATGCDSMLISFGYGSYKERVAAMRLFGREVMPAFRAS
jgi:probable F420-dependent oxidoreductase